MTVSGSNTEGAVIGLPTEGSAYTESLYAAVRRNGTVVRDGIWSGRWLLSNVRRGDTLHLHWPSFQYYEPGSGGTSLFSLARFIVICVLLRLRGTQIVWTAHNLYPHDGGKRLRIHRVARWFVVRIAGSILAHGPTAAAIVREEFKVPAHKIRVTPHGHWIDALPNDISRQKARDSLGLRHEDHVFAFVGLCKPYKGLEALIDAAGTLPPGSALVIAGKFFSSEYQMEIQERASRVGGSRVSVYPGYVNDDQLQRFLNAADTVVLPYRDILTSGAAMLAMSFGRPVIAPRRGSLVDFVPESCGILYDDAQPSGLADALRSARTREFDADRIRQAVARFTWDEAARVLIDEHQRLDLSHRASYWKTTLASLAWCAWHVDAGGARPNRAAGRLDVAWHGTAAPGRCVAPWTGLRERPRSPRPGPAGTKNAP